MDQDKEFWGKQNDVERFSNEAVTKKIVGDLV